MSAKNQMTLFGPPLDSQPNKLSSSSCSNSLSQPNEKSSLESNEKLNSGTVAPPTPVPDAAQDTAEKEQSQSQPANSPNSRIVMRLKLGIERTILIPAAATANDIAAAIRSQVPGWTASVVDGRVKASPLPTPPTRSRASRQEIWPKWFEYWTGRFIGQREERYGMPYWVLAHGDGTVELAWQDGSREPSTLSQGAVLEYKTKGLWREVPEPRLSGEELF